MLIQAPLPVVTWERINDQTLHLTVCYQGQTIFEKDIPSDWMSLDSDVELKPAVVEAITKARQLTGNKQVLIQFP